jgi:hypothetical protein
MQRSSAIRERLSVALTSSRYLQAYRRLGSVDDVLLERLEELLGVAQTRTLQHKPAGRRSSIRVPASPLLRIPPPR